MEFKIAMQWAFLISMLGIFALYIYRKIEKSRKEIKEFQDSVIAIKELEKESVDSSEVVEQKNKNKMLKKKYKDPMWSFWIALLITVGLVAIFKDYHRWVGLSSIAATIAIYFNALSDKKVLLEKVQCPYCGEKLLNHIDAKIGPIYKIRDGRCKSCKRIVE